jgi:hypothetical protein
VSTIGRPSRGDPRSKLVEVAVQIVDLDHVRLPDYIRGGPVLVELLSGHAVHNPDHSLFVAEEDPGFHPDELAHLQHGRGEEDQQLVRTLGSVFDDRSEVVAGCDVGAVKERLRAGVPGVPLDLATQVSSEACEMNTLYTLGGTVRSPWSPPVCQFPTQSAIPLGPRSR